MIAWSAPLFVATGIGTTGLGIGRALAIYIDTHAFVLCLTPSPGHMSATSGLYSFLFVAVSVNNLDMDGCVLQVDRLLAIKNMFSGLPSCGKWLAHWRNGWSARGEPIRSHCERTIIKEFRDFWPTFFLQVFLSIFSGPMKLDRESTPENRIVGLGSH